MMKLFTLIKAFWRGFVGGPDFNRDINHRFILEDKQLTIKVPSSNVVAEYRPDKSGLFSIKGKNVRLLTF